MDKFLLFLSLCSLVYGQDDSDRVPVCPNTIEQLVRGGECTIGCITFARDRCPMCQEGCTDLVDECRPADPSSCTANQICLARGAGGRYVCVDRLAEGQECQTGLDFIDDVIRQREELELNERDLLDQLNTVVPCQVGLVCRRESLERSTCVDDTGPCPRARERNEQVVCDENGNFEPLQCRKMADSRTIQCTCVQTSTGMPVPDTEVEVSDRGDLPDCEDLVRARCTYRSALGVLFDVRSGDTFIDVRNCRRCLCRDGEAELCEDLRDGACDVINPTAGPNRDCTIRGRTLPNGESVAVDCNRCACKGGELVCTQRDCEEDEEDDGGDEEDPEQLRSCRACGAMRADPVCGDDGRTYPSRCFALNCRGLDAEDLIPGPCSRRDFCSAFPCEDGEVCVRSGGVTCLSRKGCRVERFRRCVDFNALTCKRREGDDDGDGDDERTDETPTDGNGEEPTSDGEEPTSDGDDTDEESSGGDDDDEGAVCGRDRRTYSSICNLIQNSPQTGVAYAGRCNRTECISSGEVCGTDGETYDNICELRSNSANARVDYRGECEDPDEPDEVIDSRCARLRRSGRCADLTDCDTRIRPGDGCCPVCGGAVTIGLDRDAVDEYVRLNPDLDTVDDFLKELVASGFIPEEVIRRCKVVASLLRTGDLQVVLENIMRSETACALAAERIANRINNPPTSDDGTSTTMTANPQVLQLATVAQTSPLVDESGNLPTSGAVPIVSFSLAAMLIPIMNLLM